MAFVAADPEFLFPILRFGGLPLVSAGGFWLSVEVAAAFGFTLVIDFLFISLFVGGFEFSFPILRFGGFPLVSRGGFRLFIDVAAAFGFTFVFGFSLLSGGSEFFFPRLLLDGLPLVSRGGFWLLPVALADSDLLVSSADEPLSPSDVDLSFVNLSPFSFSSVLVFPALFSSPLGFSIAVAGLFPGLAAFGRNPRLFRRRWA